MCVAIAIKPGVILPRDVVDSCDYTNPHGRGYAVVASGKKGRRKVIIRKSYGSKDLDRFYDEYVRDAEKHGATSSMLLHFRIATQGTIDITNCHPFPIKGGALIHNGSFYSRQSAAKSDTREVAEALGELLEYDVVMAKREAIEKHIGSYNKVGILYDTGDLVLLNQSKWVKAPGRDDLDGALFSNLHWKGRAL